MPLPQGIINTANVPELIQLVRSVLLPTPLFNPHSGVGTLVSWDSGRPAYGIKWSVQVAPAEAGRRDRAITVFQIPFLSLAMHYVFADGSDFIGDNVLTGDGEGFAIFRIGQPTTIGYDVSDGWLVNFAWLVAP